MTRNSVERMRTLLDLGPWLVEHGQVTLAEAAEAFGLTAEEVEADVGFLNAMEVPGFTRGLDFGYATAASTEDGVITVDPQDSLLTGTAPLSSEEATALLVAISALADLPGVSDVTAIRSARDKLAEGLAGLAPATTDLSVSLAESVDEGVLQSLREAMLDDRQVHLDYLVISRDELTERVVDPLRVGTMDGRWYLQAWCHRAHALRQFRLDQVRGLKVLRTRRRVLPDDVELGAPGDFQPSSSALRVVVELEPGARWVSEYFPMESVEELENGRLRTALWASSPEWAMSLALRLGNRASIVAPVSLAARVRTEAVRALAQYLDA